MWSKLGKLALNVMKNGGIEETFKKGTKKILYAVIAVFVFFMILVATVDALKNSFLCNDVIELKCPKPPVDLKKVADLSQVLHSERAKVWNSLEDQENNHKFRTAADIGKTQGSDEDKEVFSEAEYIIRIMAAIDFNTYVDYVKTGDLKKGMPLDESVIDKNLKYAREDMSSWYLSSGSEDKKFKKNRVNYLMDWRIKVYECYLLGKGCSDEILESMGTESYQGVAIKKNGSNFTYQQPNQILNDFYEISFLKYLDGKVKKIPEGESENIFLEMINEQKLSYNEIYPAILPSGTASSISAGWLIPMIPGTYNFSSPYGPRGGAMHKGVDMGTMKVNAVPYFAAKSGVVVSAGWNDGGYGGVVTLDHGDGYFTTYSHMETKNIVVRKGQKVAQGQLIGAAGGEPGLPIHLHFEVCTSLGSSSGYDLSGGTMKICGERVDPEKEDIYGNSLRQDQNMKLTKEYANTFLNEWKVKASTEVIIMPGFSPVDISSLAFEHEGADPSKCIAAFENKSHLACGAFQLTHTSIGGFLENLKNSNPDLYDILKNENYMSYNESFVRAWKKAYDNNPTGFYQAQVNYLYISHYEPVARKLNTMYGYDVFSAPVAIQSMIFSSATQHRNNTQNIIWKESIGKSWTGKSDYEIIDMFWNRRSQYSCCKNRWILEEYQTKELLATGKFTSKSELWQPLINKNGSVPQY